MSKLRTFAASIGIAAVALAQPTMPSAGQRFHHTLLGNEDICPAIDQIVAELHTSNIWVPGV
jgi:hypothetical protein